MKPKKFVQRALLKLRRSGSGSAYGYFQPAEVFAVIDYFGRDKCRIRAPGYDSSARRKVYMEHILQSLRTGDCYATHHYFEVARDTLDAFEESLDYLDRVRFNPERRRKPVKDSP